MAEATLQDQELELEVLKKEIQQAEQSLESDFAKYAGEHIDAQLEALFFDDRVGFIKKILEMQNQFLSEQLGQKVQRAKDLQEDITLKRGMQDLEKVKAEFLNAHPEANIDEILEFYNEELPPKYQKQLESLQGLDFFNTLYELYKAFKGTDAPQDKQESQEPQEAQQPPQEELPKRLEGNTPNNPSSANSELVMNRF
ncbi:Coiled-coil domain-containing protein [Helicobacter felis]|uniref:Coiled-coil domain-containing protein n=1 Tax=Helicobacter felis TaxID=214 RepID=UPI000CF0E99E|nr:Coiled-coil domain-containing protein [Helicobacter felis]